MGFDAERKNGCRLQRRIFLAAGVCFVMLRRVFAAGAWSRLDPQPDVCSILRRTEAGGRIRCDEQRVGRRKRRLKVAGSARFSSRCVASPWRWSGPPRGNGDGANRVAQSIAAAVSQQGEATAEIARNVQQASKGAQAVNDNIGGVLSMAQNASAASNQMLASAEMLAQQSGQLRREVDAFLEAVRAA